VLNKTRRFPSPFYKGFGFVGRINLDNCLSKTAQFVKKKGRAISDPAFAF
jgi:hypothetical protein